MSNIFHLNQKKIVLTGATGHLGMSIANTLLDSGAFLILYIRNDSQELTHLLDRFPSQSKSYYADLEDTDSLKQACKSVLIDHPSIDGIVNNAYSGEVGTLENIEEADFIQSMKMNLFGPFSIIKFLLPGLTRSSNIDSKNFASIVNISSMYGKVSPQPEAYDSETLPNPIQYGATKSGLIQLTKYLACFLADKGIRVNSISPGAFPNIKKVNNPQFISRLESRIPLKRIGYPEELGGPVAFLLSEASSYITGADISVDGGWTSW